MQMKKKNLGRKKTLRYSQDLNLGLLNASQILFPTDLLEFCHWSTGEMVIDIVRFSG